MKSERKVLTSYEFRANIMTQGSEVITYMFVVIHIITDFRTKVNKKVRKRRCELYERYIELRDKKGVTDYRVSKDTGITKSTFTDWKNGRSAPKIEKLALLAKYFDVPIEYFIE